MKKVLLREVNDILIRAINDYPGGEDFNSETRPFVELLQSIGSEISYLKDDLTEGIKPYEKSILKKAKMRIDNCNGQCVSTCPYIDRSKYTPGMWCALSFPLEPLMKSEKGYYRCTHICNEITTEDK